ncbi:MAG TPA: DUF167 domain-containing protein [Phycisphaerae bacterium]|nr:DUF167 domain-containing protein [Phycisphaerae bacterium]HPS53156.1 DUF167 domain-containing protein [Phycisphaerae bacterium]
MNARELDVRDTDKGAILAVKAVPGASRDKIAGLLGGALKVTTSTAAEKGRANKSVAAIIAKSLGVAPGNVEIIAGMTNAHKEFIVVGLKADDVRNRLEKI